MLCVQAKHRCVWPDRCGKDAADQGSDKRDPRDERLVSIEDAAELSLDTHANNVRLFYSKGEQGGTNITPKQLLEGCLRLRPDRILLGARSYLIAMPHAWHVDAKARTEQYAVLKQSRDWHE